MILNFNKNNKPRRTVCPKCNDVLIPGTDNLDRGVNFVECPKCVYVKLMKSGMVPEQMIQDDLAYSDEAGYAIGLAVQIKGIPDFELVLTEDQIENFIQRIQEDRLKRFNEKK